MSYVIKANDPEEGDLYWIEDFGWGEGLEEAMVFEEATDMLPVYSKPNAGDVEWVEVKDPYCPDCENTFRCTDLAESTSIADHGRCFDCQRESLSLELCSCGERFNPELGEGVIIEETDESVCNECLGI